MRLLRDSEAEVRVAAAGKVSAFSKFLLPVQIVQHVIPCVRELSMDSSQYVRAALASVVMELAPVLGKQNTIDHLVPVFLTLLKDVYPDVRLNVISKLDQVNQVRVQTWGKQASRCTDTYTLACVRVRVRACRRHARTHVCNCVRVHVRTPKHDQHTSINQVWTQPASFKPTASFLFMPAALTEGGPVGEE